jgi:putative transposase
LAEKKVRGEPVSVRRERIERAVGKGAGGLAVSRRCALAGVARSRAYEPQGEEAVDAPDLRLLEPIDARYTARPFYGGRRMAPGPATGKSHPEHRIYP